MNRQLDLQIAVEIFGYTQRQNNNITTWFDDTVCIASQTGDNEIVVIRDYSLPSYSTDLNDAWLLVDWMINEKHVYFTLEPPYWTAKGSGLRVTDKTAQLAICKIALKIARR